MGLTVKQVSNLEKFIGDIENVAELSNRKTVMKGEEFSYQIAMQSSNNAEIKVEIIFPIKDSIKLYAVKNAVIDLPVYISNDEFFAAPDDDQVQNTPFPVNYDPNDGKIHYGHSGEVGFRPENDINNVYEKKDNVIYFPDDVINVIPHDFVKQNH